MATPEEARVETVDELVRRSQECVRSADYEGAIQALRKALELSPEDAHLRSLADRTQKAAERHAATVGRQRAVRLEARDIGRLLDGHDGQEPDLAAAHDRLRRAVAEHGRQALFDELQERLDQMAEAQRQARAEVHLRRASGRERAGDLQGALHEVEQALSLEPELAGATTLRDAVRGRLDEAEGERRRLAAIDEAVREAERWLMVGELDRAEQRIESAVEALGATAEFHAMTAKIQASREAQEAARQGEWAERRQREAESLIRSAAQRSLAGDFQSAVEQLEAAERMNLRLPELEERLTTARQALERQRHEQAELASRDAAIQQIRHRLDALHLDDAAAAIDDAVARFGETDSFATLRHRLDGLREAESAAGTLPTPADLPKLGIAARQAIRRRETTVAAAYGWLQVMLYPSRGSGPQLIVLLAIVSVAATVLHPLAGWGFLALAWAIVAPPLLRTTVEGANRPSALLWAKSSPGRDFRSLGRIAPVLLVTLLPTVAILAARLAGLLADALAWPLAAVGGWLACALIVPAAAVAVTFGDGSRWRFDRHLERLGEPAAHAVVLLVYAVGSMLILARAVLAAKVPILGPSLTALVDAYAMLLLPHAIGVVLRGDRLAWAELYAR